MRDLMTIVETQSRGYLHASQAELPVGAILRAGKGRGATVSVTAEVEAIFEETRPSDKPSRSLSVYMTDDWDTLESFGLADDAWVYLAQPTGPVSRFDHDWHEEAATIGMRGLLDDGIREEIAKLAREYWSGISKSEYPNWEYLTPTAVITDILQELED